MTVRLIEDDIFSGVPSGSSGASAVIDYDTASTISCQLIYQVTSPVGASITYQGSNVGGLNDADWTDIRTVTITVDGSDLFTDGSFAFRFFRANKALSSGSVNVQGRVLVTGSATSSSSLLAPLTSGPITDLTNDVSASGPGSVAATVNSVGGSTASAIHTSVLATAAATASNTVSTIVKRDGSGNFAAGTITLSGLTASTVPYLDASKILTSSAVTPTELGYVSGVTSSIQTQLNAKASTTLTSAHILVGNGSNVATDVAVSGDLTLANTGAFTIANSAVTNAKIDAAAAIDFSKLAALSSGNILVGSVANVVTSVTMSGDATIVASGALTIANSAITNAKVSASAAIDFSKLATLTSGNILVGSVGGVPTSVAMSGDATIVASGALTIANSAITNAKVSATAAIDFSKLASLTSGNILVGSAGNVPTSVTMSGDATIVASGALTIANNAVTNAKLAQIATATFKGRTTAGTGDVEDLTATQATALLNAFVGDSGSGGTKGLVPAPAAGDAAAGKFLKADGTFAVPTGGSGTVTSVALTAPAFLSVGGSPVTGAGTLALTYSGTALPIANGGTGVTAAPTSASAGAFAAWDTNVNFPANNFIPAVTSTGGAAASITLTVSSSRTQILTGTGGATVTLPVASTLTLNQSFEIVNSTSDSSTVLVQSSGSNSIGQRIPAGQAQVYTCILTSGTTAASWRYTATISIATGGVTTSQIPVFSDSSGLKLSNGGYYFNNNITTGVPLANSAAVYNGQALLNVLNILPNYTSTATAAGTTTLTINSSQLQVFTGSTTQTVKLPSTGASGTGTGLYYEIWNLSTGALTIQTSTAAALQTMAANSWAKFQVNSTADNTAARWNVLYQPISTTITGTGNQVLATSPTLVTPVLGTPTSGTLSNCTSLGGITTGSAVGAGILGQVISSTQGDGSGVTVGTGATTVTSVTLTAGVWTIYGIMNIAETNAATNYGYVAIGTTTNSFTGTVLGYSKLSFYTLAATGKTSVTITNTVSISGSTTYYLIGSSDQGTAAAGDWLGTIYGVRVG